MILRNLIKLMQKEIFKSYSPENLSDSERYITRNGEISLLTPCIITKQTFEIRSIRGNFFEDVERFNTRKEAETRIHSLLC